MCIALVAMLMDPISFANRALQEMSEGLVRMERNGYTRNRDMKIKTKSLVDVLVALGFTS